MPFQISPGVNVSEIDLTTIVPAVSTTVASIGGVFSWGPVESRMLISNENELVNTFGKPTANNFETFFTASNFLAYGNQLYISRAASTISNNAVANVITASNSTVSFVANSTNVNNSTIQIKNLTDYGYQDSTIQANTTSPYFVAKYPGSVGNSLRISVCPSSLSFHNSISGNSTCNVTANIAVGTSTLAINVYGTGAQTLANVIFDQYTVGDVVRIGNTSIGTQYISTTGISVGTYTATQVGFTINLDDINRLKSSWDQTSNTSSDNFLERYWEFNNLVSGAPGTSNYVAQRNANSSIGDELHIVVQDNLGNITGIPGQILEVWPSLSRATDAKGEQGGSTYYRDVLQNNSRWVWAARSNNMLTSATAGTLASSNLHTMTAVFAGASVDDCEQNISAAKVLTAYDQFASPEDIDISLVLGGRAYGGDDSSLVANYLIDNICETRKDCVAFISPPTSKTVNVPGFEAANVIAYRNKLRSTSYAVIDSTAKYQYDKYNDVYRWVPLNGDIAGLCVRTDNVRDPWFSPAGFNRGQIKNVVKLAFNPNQANRDQLYKNGINPVVNFPGQGVILYGDKTLLAKPSAFDRINVRRLFIVLEKAIATASKFALFQFNDDFTRAAFRNLVEPYLRDVQGRRGIYDFRVVCDTTNNTPEVIDGNRFVGDIYIKPARSINFIQLNFVAVRTGVEFDEIVGKF